MLTICRRGFAFFVPSFIRVDYPSRGFGLSGVLPQVLISEQLCSYTTPSICYCPQLKCLKNCHHHCMSFSCPPSSQGLREQKYLSFKRTDRTAVRATVPSANHSTSGGRNEVMQPCSPQASFEFGLCSLTEGGVP